MLNDEGQHRHNGSAHCTITDGTDNIWRGKFGRRFTADVRISMNSKLPVSPARLLGTVKVIVRRTRACVFVPNPLKLFVRLISLIQYFKTEI